MKLEEFEEVFKNEDADWEGDNAWQGLNIIAKYLPKETLICGADYDIIYSVGVEELVDAGITIEDTEKLRRLSWMIDEECLACLV